MFGFALGVLVAVCYLAAVFEEGYATPGDVFVAAAVLPVVGWVIGLMATRTMGIAAMFGMLGAAAGALMAPFQGSFLMAFALAANALGLLLLQHALQQRMRAKGLAAWARFQRQTQPLP